METKNRWYPGSLSDEVTAMEREHAAVARHLAAESMVLLQNDGTLPLRKGQRVALYGYGARHTIKGGTGSGAVNNRGTDNVDEGLRDAGIIVTNDAWLNDYDHRYSEAWQAWKQFVIDLGAKGDDARMGLYRAHASNPMQAPEGGEMTREADTDVAIYVLSRISGEGADRKNAPGDYELSKAEWRDLRALCAAYPKVVLVLNVGGIIDLSVLDELPIAAVLLMGQAGMSGGHAAADVLTGAVNPSGRLTDTWAYRYMDYPGSATFSHNNGNVIQEYYREGIWVGYRYFDGFDIPVRYPFGYGLSYTQFIAEPVSLTAENSEIVQRVKVTNTGDCAGRNAVQAYVSCPGTVLPREKRKLVAFAKTGLLQPGESEVLELRFPLTALEAWHSGRACCLLEAGDSYVFVGQDIAHSELTGTIRLAQEHVTQRLKNICPVQDAFNEIDPPTFQIATWRDDISEAAKQMSVLEMDSAVIARETPAYEAQPLVNGEDSDSELTALLNSLSQHEKVLLCCGKPREGDAEFIGSAAASLPGAAGETTSALEERGVGAMILADGPAGIRVTKKYQLDDEGTPIDLPWDKKLHNRFFGTEFLEEGRPIHYSFCTAIPVGSLLAQSFDTALLEEAGNLIRRECEAFHVALWLAPGMNIHRNPLCGRNYEYYSEDPLVSGRMAGAITRGIQASGRVGVTIKHYACNNQEENRMGVDSIVQERALREIYLKGFEIAIQEDKPFSIMTSYNKINGVHAANNHDICSDTARSEWGFTGLIMTDWTTTNGNGASPTRCIQAGNDLTMPGTVEDIREIEDALAKRADRSLDERDLDACVLRVLYMIRKTGNMTR